VPPHEHGLQQAGARGRWITAVRTYLLSTNQTNEEEEKREDISDITFVIQRRRDTA